MNNREIIEKIKKLLRMKRGGTFAEVETALSLAQKLAHQHGIDINSIDENESAKEPITDDKIPSFRIQIECKFAALIVKNYFNVDAILGHGVYFIGTKTNIVIAQYVYNFLVKRFRYEWNNRQGKIRNRHAFMNGMCVAICYKLHSQLPKATELEGIILTNNNAEIEKYIKEKFGKTESKSVEPDRHSKTAYRQGILAGRNVDINPALKNNSAESKMLGN